MLSHLQSGTTFVMVWTEKYDDCGRSVPLTETQRVLFVTGPSGAGRSTTVHALEDMGYEALDNFPLSLIDALLTGKPLARPLVLGIDVRNRDFNVDDFLSVLKHLEDDTRYDPQLLFLDCSEERLVARFSETRRRHPLAPEDAPVVGIRQERHLLPPMRSRADFIIDTTTLTPHDLRDELLSWFGKDGGSIMGVTLHSFSYKRGLPSGLDMVFDCRFLRNPHWEQSLRAKDGRDRDVAAYVEQDARFSEFHGHVLGLMELLLPAFQEEGKTHLSVAFGCTGGRHRSVMMMESVSQALAEKGWQVSKRHRELERLAVEPVDRKGPGT